MHIYLKNISHKYITNASQLPTPSNALPLVPTPSNALPMLVHPSIDEDPATVAKISVKFPWGKAVARRFRKNDKVSHSTTTTTPYSFFNNNPPFPLPTHTYP